MLEGLIEAALKKSVTQIAYDVWYETYGVALTEYVKRNEWGYKEIVREKVTEVIKQLIDEDKEIREYLRQSIRQACIDAFS